MNEAAPSRVCPDGRRQARPTWARRGSVDRRAGGTSSWERVPSERQPTMTSFAGGWSCASVQRDKHQGFARWARGGAAVGRQLCVTITKATSPTRQSMAATPRGPRDARAADLMERMERFQAAGWRQGGGGGKGGGGGGKGGSGGRAAVLPWVVARAAARAVVARMQMRWLAEWSVAAGHGAAGGGTQVAELGLLAEEGRPSSAIRQWLRPTALSWRRSHLQQRIWSTAWANDHPTSAALRRVSAAAGEGWVRMVRMAMVRRMEPEAQLAAAAGTPGAGSFKGGGGGVPASARGGGRRQGRRRRVAAAAALASVRWTPWCRSRI